MIKQQIKHPQGIMQNVQLHLKKNTNVLKDKKAWNILQLREYS